MGTSEPSSADIAVSVVVPVYEQPDLLREALDSVGRQTFDDYEVVVVDDASSADFGSIVDEYDDARLVVHEENRGAGAARNTGVEIARGTYVAFLDADDIWDPTKLEKQHAVFEAGGDDLGLVYTGIAQYELDGSEWRRRPEWRGHVHRAELERDRIHPTSTVVVRRDAFDRAGGFDPSLPSRQDYDLWIRITEQYAVDYVDEVLVEKREQPDSISKDFERRIEGDLAVFEKVRERTHGFDSWTRRRIHSYHYHVIGRDYESYGDRKRALQYLGRAILAYPLRPVSWAMFVVALFGIDRQGRLLTACKRLVR
jgi:glycosyltransferase involved in cell wall biosynthesis